MSSSYTELSVPMLFGKVAATEVKGLVGYCLYFNFTFITELSVLFLRGALPSQLQG